MISNRAKGRGGRGAAGAGVELDMLGLPSIVAAQGGHSCPHVNAGAQTARIVPWRSPAYLQQRACATRKIPGIIPQCQQVSGVGRMRDVPLTAIEINQALLDSIGAAFDASNFDAYARHFRLPHPVQTFDRRMVITSREQLHSMFKDLRRELDLKNVVTMTRLCTSAEFEDPDTIRAVHQVWLVTRSKQVQDSYFSLTTVCRGSDGWQVCDSQYAGKETCVLNAVTRNQRAVKGDVAPVETQRAPGP
jgi:hypothetical protein